MVSGGRWTAEPDGRSEALAATGLRSVRYLKEIDKIKKIYSNDLDPKAVELMKKNFEFNDIDVNKYEGKYLDNYRNKF